MNTTTANMNDLNPSRQFARELDATARLAEVFLVGYPAMFFKIMGMTHKSRAALKTIRTAMSICSEACDSAKCAAGIYPDASLVRDNYLKVLNAVSKSPFLRPLKSVVEAQASLWDDLAEDCLVSSDGEFRDLVNKIAANA